MVKELVLRRLDVTNIFMAALLSSTKEFSEAKSRLLSKNEEESTVNVTRENICKFCPSWVLSELITMMIKYKVCAPIIDNPMASVNEKVSAVKKALSAYTMNNDLELSSQQK